MAAVRPYRVEVREDFDASKPWAHPPRLIYAPDAYHAMMRSQLRDDHYASGAGRKGRINRGEVRAVEVAAYRVSTIEASRSWLVHAVNVDEARALVDAGFKDTEPALVATRADELDILPTFSDAELMRLVATVWRNPDPVRPIEKKTRLRSHSQTTTRRHRMRDRRGKLRRSEFYYRVAPLYRWYWTGDRTRKMYEHERLLAIYAIRLAMLVPGFGPDTALPTHAPPIASHRLHSRNVSRSVIRRCQYHGLDLFDPFTADQRAALVTLATEYGYDAPSMTDFELLSLWQRGPP